uniref:Strictosidine synthase conserved region domain-containing protein n=1 Tax=Ciona savignyi TaxID=51511 RepID=H2Y808_CIOSA
MHESNVRKRKRQTEEENASQNSGNESSQRRLQESPANNSFMASIALTTVLFALLCVYGYYSSPINAVEITGVVEVPFEGSFALNRKLSKGKRIPIHAPESCVEASDKKIYLSLHDGRIVCIHPSSDGEIGAGKVENITTGIIQGAATTSDAWGHGRPLGLRLRENSLYVMDAIYGFYVVDLPTKSIKILVKPDDVSPPMKFPDDFDITADGKTVYFTDASAKYPIPLLVQEVLEGSCTGRILKYDMVSQKLEVVRDGLCFPN